MTATWKRQGDRPDLASQISLPRRRRIQRQTVAFYQLVAVRRCQCSVSVAGSRSNTSRQVETLWRLWDSEFYQKSRGSILRSTQINPSLVEALSCLLVVAVRAAALGVPDQSSWHHSPYGIPKCSLQLPTRYFCYCSRSFAFSSAHQAGVEHLCHVQLVTASYCHIV